MKKSFKSFIKCEGQGRKSFILSFSVEIRGKEVHSQRVHSDIWRELQHGVIASSNHIIWGRSNFKDDNINLLIL
jgi:hypothetical protein